MTFNSAYSLATFVAVVFLFTCLSLLALIVGFFHLIVCWQEPNSK